MKRQQLIIAGLGFVSLVFLSATACSPVSKAHAVAGVPVLEVSKPVDLVPVVQSSLCAAQAPEMVATCEAQAAKILATTLRLEFHGPSGGIGHATVVGGRYLITHNHYPISGEALSRGGDDLISAVSVFRASGEAVLWMAPLDTFTVVMLAPEELILDFHEINDVGFFDNAGVPSANFASGTQLQLQIGSEVAQVDWDMSTARIIWSRVVAVHAESGTPYVELDSFIEQGASGGGVFYNGIHIANNWSRMTDRDAQSGEIVRLYSVAALNPANMVPAGY